MDNGGVHVKTNLNSASLLHEFFSVPIFKAKHVANNYNYIAVTTANQIATYSYILVKQ